MYKRITAVESDFELLDLERGADDADEVSPYQQTMQPTEVEHQEREMPDEDVAQPSVVPSTGGKFGCCSTSSREMLSLWHFVKSLMLSPVKPESSLL